MKKIIFTVRLKDGTEITESWAFKSNEKNILGKANENAIVVMAQLMKENAKFDGFIFKGCFTKELNHQWFKLQTRLIDCRDPHNDTPYLEQERVKKEVYRIVNAC